MAQTLSHYNNEGAASMVDVSDKPIQKRVAIAHCCFCANESTIDAIMEGELPKGEAISVAKIAGIQAAKQCSYLIPLCHSLPLEHAAITFQRVEKNQIEITATMTIHSRTGVEMEALTAVSVAALTLWDMTKSIDKELAIEHIELLRKEKS